MSGKLTAKERVLKALKHEEPDRIPIDLGGCISSTITVEAYNNLKKYLGINSETEVMETSFQLAKVEDAVLEKLAVDTRSLIGNSPDQANYINETGEYTDEWGVKFERSGHYYNISKYPLESAVISDLDSYSWPDPADPVRVKGLRERGMELAGNDYAVVGSPYGFTRIFEQAWQLRGMTNLLMDLVTNKDFAHALFQKILEIQKGRWEAYLREVGEFVDVIRIGDDVAMQSGPIMSPDLYREMLKPYHREYFQFVRERTDAKILYHCCGSVLELIEDFIEIGVDILNPVQVSAREMDTRLLKERYGDDLIFWGGIDSQEVLPNGTVDDVRDEVRRRIDHLGESGGYVLCSVHNIQPDVPPENIVAMYEEAVRYSS